MFFRTSKNVKNIFNNVSYKYDFLNDLLSLGLHNLWKRELVSLANPRAGENWGDLCCGTGDISFIINKKVLPNGRVIGIDNAESILDIAKKKSDNVKNNSIIWHQEDIFNIKKEDYRFDGICMSYGLRNLKNVYKGLTKVYEILKEDGKAAFLDFNHAREKSLTDKFQKLYLRNIVVPISSIFKLSKEYSYIEKSIEDFPCGEELIKISNKIGFKKIQFKTLFFGQMCILLIQK
tara:strand:+ start:683 stop:1384 length:702 start_codon:yes stop_codon:yes gene_type:complete